MSTLLTNVPIPITDPIARRRDWTKHPRREDYDPKEGLLTEAWLDYFSHEVAVGAATPVGVASVSLAGQAAAISATDLSGGTLTSGLYVVSYYARITTAASSSSSLTVTVDFNDGGVSPSFSGTAMTGNTVTTVQSNTWLIHIDSLSPVRYSTAYASVGATAMEYRLDITLTQANAA